MPEESGQQIGARPPGTAADDFSHIRLTYIVHFYFNQQSTAALADLLRRYAGYAADVLDRLQFVLVDDGSPVDVSIPEDLDLNILLLKIREDIPWNQPGARNLGVTYARSDRIVITDLDHEFPEDTLRHMIRRRPPGRTLYKVRRYDPAGVRRSTHANTFFMSRGRFLRLYGYDEDFSGHYGFDDVTFWRWQRNHGTRSAYLPRSCRVIDRDLDRDAAYHSLERDLSHNRDVARQKRGAWAAHGPEAGHSRRFLGFSWTVRMDRRRGRPPPVPHPWWARLWLLRQILPSP